MKKWLLVLVVLVAGCSGAHGPGWDATLLMGLSSPACQQISTSLNAQERLALRHGLESCLNGVDLGTPVGGE